MKIDLEELFSTAPISNRNGEEPQETCSMLCYIDDMDLYGEDEADAMACLSAKSTYRWDEELERLMNHQPCPTWDEHLERIRHGLPVYTEWAVRVMRAMGAIPLSKYIDCLKRCTSEYALMQSLAQQLPENATYQQAANELYDLFMSLGYNSAEMASSKENAQCMALFRAFFAPINQIVSDLSSNSA